MPWSLGFDQLDTWGIRQSHIFNVFLILVKGYALGEVGLNVDNVTGQTQA